MARIFAVEISHQNASVEVREQIVLKQEQVKAALHQLGKSAEEAVIINTCNRVSIYTYAESEESASKIFQNLGDFSKYTAVYEEDRAIRKLFATASGIESQAIGEHQILGQVRQAYELAQKENKLGPVLNALFRSAIHVGRRVRGETSIGQYSTSLAAVAYDLVRDKCKELSQKSMLLIGTGEMANLVLKLIDKSKIGKLYIASQDIKRAKGISKLHAGQPITINEIPKHLDDINIIVGCTETAKPILNKDHVNNMSNVEIMVDLGLPRNFDENIKQVKQLKLYDLDDIKFFSQLSFQKRMGELPKAEKIIQEELEEFVDWLNVRENASPLISNYWNHLENIKKEELNWLLPKLGKLDENQRRNIEKALHHIIRKVSKQPIKQMKNYVTEHVHAEHPVETIKKVFDIGEEVNG